MKVRHGWLVIQKAEVLDGYQCLCIIKMVGLKNKSPLLFGTFSQFIWNLCNKLHPCNLKIWSLIVLEFGVRRSVGALFSGGNGLKTVKHRRELNANVVCFFVDFIFSFHSRQGKGNLTQVFPFSLIVNTIYILIHLTLQLAFSPQLSREEKRQVRDMMEAR